MNDQAEIASRIAIAILRRVEATPIERLNLPWFADKCNQLAAALLEASEES